MDVNDPNGTKKQRNGWHAQYCAFANQKCAMPPLS